MLELICDNRSGKKLEIVIQTLNEEKRIGNLLDYYGKDFDIVLLDDSSTDKTVELAIKSGATVFRRLIRTYEQIYENYFVYYVNEVTKSGYSFYLFADEFAKKKDLLSAYEKLKSGECDLIMGRRVEWAYGQRSNVLGGISLKGLCKGMAIYDPNSAHSNLKCKESNDIMLSKTVIDVHHLSIYSMRDYFCKASRYISYEVDVFLKSKYPFRSFLRRYIAAEFKRFLYRTGKDMDKGIRLWLFNNIFWVAIVSIASLIWIERKYLISPEEQLKTYSDFYKNEL